MNTYTSLLAFVLLSYNVSDSAKILIYNPSIGYYHMKFMGKIAEVLVNQGHDVTELYSIVNPNITRSYKDKRMKTITVEPNNESIAILERGETEDEGLIEFWTEMSSKKKMKGLFGYFFRQNNFSRMLSEQCQQVIEPIIMEQLRMIEYDLAITEVFDFCGLGVFHMLNVSRTILTSSVPINEYISERLGLPRHTDLIPSKYSTELVSSIRDAYNKFDSRSFIQNTMTSYLTGINMFLWLDHLEHQLFVSNSKDFPGFQSLMRKSHLLLENVHPLIDFSIPTLSSIIPIGGITVSKPRKLGTDVKRILNTRMKKVYVSFGTVLKLNTIPTGYKRNIISAFESINDALFIFKGNISYFDDIMIPPNVIFREWVEQNDLLGSGEIDLFISHMGMGSLLESSYSGVPMIAVPVFVDQPYNSATAIRAGSTVFVDKLSLNISGKVLAESIRKILDNQGYTTSAEHLAKSIHAYGDQVDVMLKKINFVLSLPPHSISRSFDNHYEVNSAIMGFLSTFIRRVGWVSFIIAALVIVSLYLLVKGVQLLISSTSSAIRFSFKRYPGLTSSIVMLFLSLYYHSHISPILFIEIASEKYD